AFAASVLEVEPPDTALQPCTRLGIRVPRLCRTRACPSRELLPETTPARAQELARGVPARAPRAARRPSAARGPSARRRRAPGRARHQARPRWRRAPRARRTLGRAQGSRG